MAGIEYAGSTKAFADGTVAVDALDLEIADGEFIVLVGPSGSGKTTVLRMTAGLEDADRRRDPDRRRASSTTPARWTGHRDGLPELRALSAHDRLREHGVRPQAAPASSKDEIRAAGRADARRCSGSTTCCSASRAQLSGGQRQRVAMGRAIVREPTRS